MSNYRRQINTLLLKIKNGDKSKLDDIFDLTFNHLKFVALHYLFVKRDFEDALSEAYLRMLKYIQSFNIFKDGYNWLCKIVQNVAYDMNKENCQYVSEADVLIDDFSYTDEIDKMLEKDALYCYVKNFSKIDRQIIYYRFYMNLTFAEIANKLSRTKSFIYNRIKILSEKILKNFEI